MGKAYLNHIGCCYLGSFIRQIKQKILSTYYFIIIICPLILINGFRKHDTAAIYINDYKCACNKGILIYLGLMMKCR